MEIYKVWDIVGEVNVLFRVELTMSDIIRQGTPEKQIACPM